MKLKELPDDVQTLVRVAYFLTSKAVPVRVGEERDIIAYRVPVREFERLRAKSEAIQAALAPTNEDTQEPENEGGF